MTDKEVEVLTALCEIVTKGEEFFGAVTPHLKKLSEYTQEDFAAMSTKTSVVVYESMLEIRGIAEIYKKYANRVKELYDFFKELEKEEKNKQII